MKDQNVLLLNGFAWTRDTLTYWQYSALSLSSHRIINSLKVPQASLSQLSFEYKQIKISVWMSQHEILKLDHIIYMGESFQDYSWIQDFEADFP